MKYQIVAAAGGAGGGQQPGGNQPNRKLGKKNIRPPHRTCPRCYSGNTKFIYFNNRSLDQPRYLCNFCRRTWTDGGTLRYVPYRGPRLNLGFFMPLMQFNYNLPYFQPNIAQVRPCQAQAQAQVEIEIGGPSSAGGHGDVEADAPPPPSPPPSPPPETDNQSLDDLFNNIQWSDFLADGGEDKP